MKVYVDFDGVILDTDKVLKKEFIGDYNSNARREFVKNYDWFKLMDDNLIINDSLNFLRGSIYDIFLLSKISSMCEGQAKVKYLRNNNVNIDICFVPTGINKCDVVSASENILIDDKIANLNSWSESGGISIYFNKNGDSVDIHGVNNPGYIMISDLKCLVDNSLNEFIKK